MNGYDNERDEVSEAAVGIMRAVARGLPYIMWGIGIGILLNFVLSSPFEVSCRTVKVRREPRKEYLLATPVESPKAKSIVEPVKQGDEE
jgi:hypothetical protein